MLRVEGIDRMYLNIYVPGWRYGHGINRASLQCDEVRATTSTAVYMVLAPDRVEDLLRG